MVRLIQPTQHEVMFSANELIVTKTDLKGRITYANKTFMQIADFNEEELLGFPHNVIRHPDMPRGVFWGLWNALQAKKEFFGFVKNMTASGDHYWVFANIRPDQQNGQIVGYFSVRRPITLSMRQSIESIYHEMIKVEMQSSVTKAAEASWIWLMDEMARKNTNYDKYILNLYHSE